MSNRLIQPHPKVNFMMKHLVGLDVEGIEKSFKISSKTLLQNRFIIGISCPDKNRKQIFNACHEIGMPENCLDSFREHFAKASLVYFGVEENNEHISYKVYLEFWSEFIRRQAIITDKNTPFILHTGYKWNANNNSQNTIAHYKLFPNINIEKILNQVEAIYDGFSNNKALTITKSIIETSAKTKGSTFKFLEVEEENNPRKSFDINLYEANLKMYDIYPHLKKIQDYYDIDHTQFDPFYQQIQGSILGHLSGGIDKLNNDFMTLYYEANTL